MQSAILSWILSLQMLLATPIYPQDAQPCPLTRLPTDQAQETRLWWGLIDPELSLWFSRLPERAPAPDAPVLWDFSWRGFLAALFGQPIIEEDAAHAPQA